MSTLKKNCRLSHAALAKRVTELGVLTDSEVDACLVAGCIAPTPGAMLCGVTEFIDVWHQGGQRTTALGSTCDRRTSRSRMRSFKQATRVVIVANNQNPTKRGYHWVVFVADITSRTVHVYDSWRRGNLSLGLCSGAVNTALVATFPGAAFTFTPGECI